MSKYWEKTVEYSFVIQACRERGVEFFAPLAGKEERGAGDAMFGSAAELILVEFKINEKIPKEELEKFRSFPMAYAALHTRDSHHFLVYPKSTITAGQRLPSLMARRYFEGTPLHSAMTCFDHGAHPEVFKEYIRELLTFRKEDGRSSSGQVGYSALENVVGIDKRGNEISSVTLKEYVEFELPALALENELRNDAESSLSSGPD